MGLEAKVEPTDPDVCPKCRGDLGWTLRGSMDGNPYRGNVATCRDCDYFYEPSEEWLRIHKR